MYLLNFLPKFNKYQFILILLILNLAITATLTTTNIINRTHNQNTLSHLGNATEYICNTTNILDVIVKQAYSQTHTNFKLGEYTRLERAGVLTKHDVALARHNLKLFLKFHQELQRNSECQFTIVK